VFSPHHTVPDTEITHQLLAKHTPPDHVLFTLHEVRKVVHLLNNGKSLGPDLVTAKMLKELPKKSLLTLLYIFNGILRTHHWPAALKTAEIILLLKPGKDPKRQNLTAPLAYYPLYLKSSNDYSPTESLLTLRIHKGYLTISSDSGTNNPLFNRCTAFVTPSIQHLKQNSTAPAPSSTSAKLLIRSGMMVSCT